MATSEFNSFNSSVLMRSDSYGSTNSTITNDSAYQSDASTGEQAVKTALARLDSWVLADAKDNDTLRMAIAPSGLTHDIDGVDLSELRQKVLSERFGRQRLYMQKLRKSLGDTQWKANYSVPGSNDAAYEYFLENGDAATSTDYECWKHGGATTRQPMLRSSTRQPMVRSTEHKASIYDVDLATKGFDCGTILIVEPNLQQLCELGDRLESKIGGFDLSSAFLNEHHTGEPSMLSQDARVSCSVEGWAVDHPPRPLEVLIERPTVHDDAELEAALGKALSRISCLQVQDSLFLVLVRIPMMPLPCRPQEKASAIPVSGWTSFHNTSSRLQSLPDLISRCLGEFFNVGWNARRVRDLWTTTPREWLEYQDSEMRRRAFYWLLGLQGFERKIDRLTNERRALDYELIKLPSHEALDRIKSCRNEVAELRQDIALSRDTVRTNGLVECYQISHDEMLAENQTRQKKWTARQKASASFDEEYDWIDERAKALMPLLNEHLQLIMTTMSIEQTNMALADAKVSKKNNERSTVFAGLATLYLPLSLTTGFFGMNLHDMTNTSPQMRWWAFTIVAIVLTTLSMLIVWFFLSRKRRIGNTLEKVLHGLTGGWWGQLEETRGEVGQVQTATDEIDHMPRVTLEQRVHQSVRAWWRKPARPGSSDSGAGMPLVDYNYRPYAHV